MSDKSSADEQGADSEREEHLVHPVVPDHMRGALEQLARENEAVAAIPIGEKEDLNAAERADAARRVIEGDRRERGPRSLESRYSPGEMMVRLKPDDTNFIAVTVEWYAGEFARDELTAGQALDLLRDARTQGLYRFDQESGTRTPIQVADEELRGQVVELFGEGTDNEGSAEQVLQLLRARERGRGGEFEPASGRQAELQSLVQVFEGRINDLNETNPDSREGWKQILDDFIDGGLFEYSGDKLVSNIRNKDLRDEARALLKKAREKFDEATSKAGLATSGAEARAHARAARPDSKVRRQQARPYDLDDQDRGERADNALRDEQVDPHGLAREARRTVELGPGARERRERLLNQLARALDSPEKAEPDAVVDDRPTDYDASLEPYMQEAYDRDPVAKAVEGVRKRWKELIDEELDGDVQERLRGQQHDAMNIERDRIEAVLEQRRRARIEDLKRPGGI